MQRSHAGLATDPTPAYEFEALVAGPDGERTFFDRSDVAAVGTVDDRDGVDGYGVPVDLSEDGTDEAADAFRAVGADEAPADASITVRVDGEEEVENTYQLSPDLARTVAASEWDGEFVLMADDREQAEVVREALAGGD